GGAAASFGLYWIAVAAALLGAAVTGWMTDNFEAEYIDGGASAIVALVLTLLIFTARVRYAPIPGELASELAFFVSVFGVFAAILFGPLVAFAGAFFGWLAARVSRNEIKLAWRT
ncbi:MAG: hypothetical protein ABEI52_02810, partial [Halobacteriaceae archaeon]